MKKTIVFLLLNVIIASSCSQRNDNEPVIKFKTSEGTIVVKLYPETPKHRDNFVKLVEAGFYEGVLFHRVIADFMIQAGDPDSKNAGKRAMLGSGDVKYTVPAEIVYPKYYHKKGALAAARQGDDTNPERASSGAAAGPSGQDSLYPFRDLDRAVADLRLVRFNPNQLVHRHRNDPVRNITLLQCVDQLVLRGDATVSGAP